MSQRSRKLIGAVLLLALVGFWALFAMSLAQGRVSTLPGYGQFLVYLVLGFAWVVPAGFLLRWMLKP